MGALSLKSNNINFGTIKKGQAVTKEIEYANKTDKNVTVALILPGKGMDGQVTLEVVKPNETGKLVFVFNSSLQKAVRSDRATGIRGCERQEVDHRRLSHHAEGRGSRGLL